MNGHIEEIVSGQKVVKVFCREEEEIKKFNPSLEVEDVGEAIYNQDITDVADILIRMIKEEILDFLLEELLQ